MNIIRMIGFMVATLFFTPLTADDCPAVEIRVKTPNWYGLEKEIPTIKKAAEKNNCRRNLFLILCAVRKAENGRPGYEFGVKHLKDTDLARQADYAARIIVHQFNNWKSSGNMSGGFPAFIDYLADIYCPPRADPVGNENWKNNVEYWFFKFKRNYQ